MLVSESLSIKSGDNSLMNSKKLIPLFAVLMLVMGSATAVTTDTDGIDHVNPAMNDTELLRNADSTITLTSEVSTDSIGGTNLSEGDVIDNIQFTINDSDGDTYTITSFNISEVDYYSDSDLTDVSSFTVGTDIAVDSTAEIVAEVNRSQLEDANISFGQDSTLTLESQYNVTGTMEYERTEFYITTDIGSYIFTIIIPILFLLVVLMLWREFKDVAN